MRLTFLGHASWLVEAGTTAIITDPVLVPFRRGLFTVCPTRQVELDRIPRFDGIVISHKHRDHFDPDTLDRLNRDATVYCPRDPVILRALRRLGYERVVPVGDWSYHQHGDLTMVFTPSENRVPEVGILFSAADDTVFWNQVDTVIGARAIETVLENAGGPVDLVAHGYQPMYEIEALEGRSLEFPAGTYAQILRRAQLLGPRALVPGSNGYRVTGAQAWFNAYKFPVSRERFVRDVGALLPGTSRYIPNPGDVLEVTPAGTTFLPQAAAERWVWTVRDDAAELMAFNPSAPKPGLVDDNPDELPLAELRRMVRRLFEERVVVGCGKLGRMHPYRAMGAVFQFRVIYPDAREESWILDLSGGEPRIGIEDRGDATDFVMELAASSLHGLATGRMRADVVALAGMYRLFSRPYRVGSGGIVTLGELGPTPLYGKWARFPWILFDWIHHEPGDELRLIDAELDRLLAPDLASGEEVPFWERRPSEAWPMERAVAAP